MLSWNCRLINLFRVSAACRVAYDRDLKVMNAATFVVQREDHTIGNVLRMYEHARTTRPASCFLMRRLNSWEYVSIWWSMVTSVLWNFYLHETVAGVWVGIVKGDPINIVCDLKVMFWDYWIYPLQKFVENLVKICLLRPERTAVVEHPGVFHFAYSQFRIWHLQF